MRSSSSVRSVRMDAEFAEERSRKADDFPKDKWEAMQHIKDIRRGKEKYGGDGMVQGLLKQTQEHNSTTHRFLYELLQNADDNKYDTPLSGARLFIRYQNGDLLIESNEIGFSKPNVESICRAAQSSKKGHPTRQSIGEKGIGFKSVFMISSSVWITSGQYSFRFDRDGELGWILPHWDDQFPMQQRKSSTSIVLRIDENRELKANMSKTTMSVRVIGDLSKLGAMDLMFLAKLKHVEIEILHGSLWTSWITETNDRRITLKADLRQRDNKRLLDTMVSHDGVVEPLVAFPLQQYRTAVEARRLRQWTHVSVWQGYTQRVLCSGIRAKFSMAPR